MARVPDPDLGNKSQLDQKISLNNANLEGGKGCATRP